MSPKHRQRKTKARRAGREAAKVRGAHHAGWPSVRHIALVAGFTFAMALLSQVLEFRDWESGFETTFKDALLKRPPDTWLPWWLGGGVRKPDPHIALVTIDQAAYEQCFDPPNRLAPATVMEMLERLDAAKPAETKVIAIDLLTDDSHYAARRLNVKAATIYATGAAATADDETFLDWLWTDAAPVYLVKPTNVLGQPFGIGGGSARWAPPTYPTDRDGVLRRLPHTARMTTGVDRPTFAAAVASTLSTATSVKAPDEVFMDFSAWRPEGALRRFAASDLFTCTRTSGDTSTPAQVVNRDAADFTRFGDGAEVVVLVGATYEGTGDRHETPLGRMSGVELNAYAIRSEAGDRGVREVPPLCMLLVEWVSATVVLLAPRFFARRERAAFWVRLVAFALFVAVGLGLHSVRSMWPGVIWAFEYVWEWIVERTPLNPDYTPSA